jgi:hypothetical protein
VGRCAVVLGDAIALLPVCGCVRGVLLGHADCLGEATLLLAFARWSARDRVRCESVVPAGRTSPKECRVCSLCEEFAGGDSWMLHAVARCASCRAGLAAATAAVAVMLGVIEAAPVAEAPPLSPAAPPRRTGADAG